MSGAREFAEHAGLEKRIQFIQADAAAYLRRTDGRYDFIPDDAWFGRQPD
jgi:predicted O-methyltransferase YrrM